MATRYTLRLDNQCIELSKANSNILVYKIPYAKLKSLPEDYVKNKFVVYILYQYGVNGKDVLYVGKSKNGLANRPTSHEDKSNSWLYCFVLTQFVERTFFNDGTTQYLEDKIRYKIDSTNRFVNTTLQTTSGTANKSDEDDCNDYLAEAYNMLYALGLNLIDVLTPVIEVGNKVEAPVTRDRVVINKTDVVFTLQRDDCKATGVLCDDGFKVLQGSYVSLDTKYKDTDKSELRLKALREELENSGKIAGRVFTTDVVFGSAHAASSVITGKWGSRDHWKTSDGKKLGEVITGVSQGKSSEVKVDVPDEDKSGTKRTRIVKSRVYPQTLINKPLYIMNEKLNVIAEGYYNSKIEFFVKSGSVVCDYSLMVKSFATDMYLKSRKELEQQGVIKDNVFQQDTLFSSVSEAASVILARSTNGYVAWVDDTGVTLDVLTLENN